MVEDYWGAGYWGDGYWATGYWGQGGTVTASAPVHAVWVTRKRLSPKLLMLIKQYLEAKVNKS